MIQKILLVVGLLMTCGLVLIFRSLFLQIREESRTEAAKARTEIEVEAEVEKTDP